MEENPFENNELCSGGQCASKHECARYMGNVDIQRAKNQFIVFNHDWCICCSGYLDRPSDDYPEKTIR